jgi:Ca2+/Na+ antiporter
MNFIFNLDNTFNFFLQIFMIIFIFLNSPSALNYNMKFAALLTIALVISFVVSKPIEDENAHGHHLEDVVKTRSRRGSHNFLNEPFLFIYSGVGYIYSDIYTMITMPLAIGALMINPCGSWKSCYHCLILFGEAREQCRQRA